MNNFISLFSLLFILSCSNEKGSKPDKDKEMDIDVAIHFLNDYTEYCNKRFPLGINKKWIESNDALTDDFKSTYKQVLDSAFKVEPELGLGFNPIFSAQDYPEKGFELLDFNNSTQTIIVQGIGYNEFQLRLKMKQYKNKWFVDGCGVINMTSH